MDFFNQDADVELVRSPNGADIWWHNMPLPGRRRIVGASHDLTREFKMWTEMGIFNSLQGKRVLDIGANDGFFSLASLVAGAAHVTAMDSAWSTWPANIQYASEQWDLAPQIVTGDFRTFEPDEAYDVVLFLGVLYHVEDVSLTLRKLRSLLKDGGTLYIETQMSRIKSDLPIFECASDIYPTVAPQAKRLLNRVGLSNFYFPNAAAMHNLAHSFDFEFQKMRGIYSKKHPTRAIFKFVKKDEEIYSSE